MTENSPRRISRENEKALWVLILTAGASGLAALSLWVTIAWGPGPFVGGAGGGILIWAGLSVITSGLIPRAYPGRGKEDPISVFTQVCLGLGAAAWIAAPLVMNAGGIAWTDFLGTGRRRFTLWTLALTLWGSVAAMVWGAAVVLVRKRRAEREQGDEPNL